MRFSILMFCLAVIALSSSAQLSDTLLISRDFYIQAIPDSTSKYIAEVESYADSLSGKKSKKYLFKLDSLATSQNTVGDIHVVVLAWERLYKWYSSTSNIKARDLVANKIFSAWDSGNLTEPMEKVWTDKLIAMFENKRDFEKLYVLRNKKSLEELQFKNDTIAVMESQISELKGDLLNREIKLQNVEKQNTELNNYLIGLAAGGALVLLLLLWMLMRNYKIKRKLKHNLKKDNVKEETKILAAKLASSEREKEQLKEIASVGINKLNELDSTINNALVILNKTTEELEMTIQESTNLTETSRKELPVALYMSQKNLLHRIGNQAIQELKSCADTLRKSVK